MTTQYTIRENAFGLSVIHGPDDKPLPTWHSVCDRLNEQAGAMEEARRLLGETRAESEMKKLARMHPASYLSDHRDAEITAAIARINAVMGEKP